jgi:hypothetical protein
MTDKPRRPILHLKFAPDAPAPTPRAPAAPAAAPSVAPRPFAAPRVRTPMARAYPVKPQPVKAPAWKCKPCGTAFDVANELADDDSVRCPSCNARLGLAGDFRAETPNLARLRARATAGR